MSPKGYKFIPVTPEYDIAVPEGLSADQEAALIARRMAELDPAALAIESAELEELGTHPERAVPMAKIIRELELMDQAPTPDIPCPGKATARSGYTRSVQRRPSPNASRPRAVALSKSAGPSRTLRLLRRSSSGWVQTRLASAN
jgi:hypothetical protein